MRKSKVTILIFIIVVILSGAGVWKWKNKPVKNITEPQKNELDDLVTEKDPLALEKIDTSNWKTYRNEEFGFEVKYPEDWEKGGSDEGEKYLAIIFNQKNAKRVIEGLREGSIITYVSTDKDKEPILTELKRLKKERNISVRKTNAGGFSGYYFSGYSEGLRMIAGNYDFSITSSLGAEKTDFDNRIRNVLNGMIQSLHFID